MIPRSRSSQTPLSFREALTFELGLTRRNYSPTKDSARLAAFLKWARCHNGLLVSAPDTPAFSRAVGHAGLIDAGLAEVVPLWRRMPDYAHGFLRRKMLMRSLAVVPLSDRKIDWHTVPRATLRNVAPSSLDILEQFPMEWTAAQISALCFGRDDWVLLAPVFACLFSEIAQKFGDEEAKDCLTRVASPAFAKAVTATWDTHGYAEHPYNILRRL